LETELCLESLDVVEGDPGSFLPCCLWAVTVGDWMYAPGMMYLGRAGPSKMIELTPLSLSLIDVEDGGEEDGTNTAGRIGPSKMSTHSLTFSVLGVPGVGIEGVLNSEEGDGGGMVGVRGNIWACLEMEEEWVRRTNAEELRRMAEHGGYRGGWMSERVERLVRREMRMRRVDVIYIGRKNGVRRAARKK